MRRNPQLLTTCAFITALVLFPALGGAEENEPNGLAGADNETVKTPPSVCTQESSEGATGAFQATQVQFEGTPEPLFLAGTCTISLDCECEDVTKTCSGPVGTCFSGGSGCTEWIQCGGGGKDYCRDPEPPQCPATCSNNSHCTSYCGGFGICRQGCCLC